MLVNCESCKNNPAIIAGYCVECIANASDTSGLPLELVTSMLLDGMQLVKVGA
jgi:hypothetical protein